MNVGLLLGAKFANQFLHRRGSTDTSEHYRTSSRRPGLDRTLSVLSVLVMVVAFILAMLCLFAGNKPGFMEDYSIFTLNVSRIGENLKDELTGKVADIDFDFLNRRALEASPARVSAGIITAPPSMIPNFRRGLLDDAQSGLDAAKGQAQSIADDAGDSVDGAISDAKGEINKGLNKAQSEVIKLIDEAYTGILEGLNLESFYSIHIMATCKGDYVTSGGKNITVGSDVMPDNGTHKDLATTKCDRFSDLNPVSLGKVIYIIAIVHAGIALLGAIAGNFTKAHWKSAAGESLVSVVASAIIGLASAVTHGVAVGAAKLINFVGQDVGVAGDAGYKFIALTWAVTILLSINGVLWAALAFLRHRKEKAIRADTPITPNRPNITVLRDLQPQRPEPYYPRNHYDRGQPI